MGRGCAWCCELSDSLGSGEKAKHLANPRPKNDSPNRFLNGLSNPPISKKSKIKQKRPAIASLFLVGRGGAWCCELSDSLGSGEKAKHLANPRPKNDSPNRFLNGLSNPPISKKSKIKQKRPAIASLFLVGRGGFEPPKSSTADLQSAPFGHSGTYPYSITKKWSWWTDSNPRPADYKSAALPTELHQRLNARI